MNVRTMFMYNFSWLGKIYARFQAVSFEICVLCQLHVLGGLKGIQWLKIKICVQIGHTKIIICLFCKKKLECKKKVFWSCYL